MPIAKDWRAVEGLSGAAVLYLIFAVGLTCCLGGISFLAFLAIVLDVCFCGAMIAIAILTRNGAHSCTGYVHTPLGTGPANAPGGFNNDITYKVKLSTACRLNTAVFAVSIIGALLFLVTAALQIALVRHHKKEKRFGPSPDNNYTSGSGKAGKRGRFARNKNTKNLDDSELGTTGAAGKRSLFARNKKTNNLNDNELGTTGAIVGGVGVGEAAAHHHDIRPSHETGYTGSTVAGNNNTYDKVHEPAMPQTTGTHGGYYTQPQGTGANPYGYDTTTTTHTNTTGPTYTTGTATNY